jgi:hypothetical protein
MSIAHIIGHDLKETLLTNGASQTHGLYALAQALQRWVPAFLFVPDEEVLVSSTRTTAH